ncbi:MAG: AAA family ATPase [Nocardioidaceae bacterium]
MTAPDPWAALDDVTASPAAVDAQAAELVAELELDDVRRAAGLTSWLVRRACLDGSTALPAGTLAAALRGFGITDPVPGVGAADDAGRVVAIPEERLLAPPEVAAAEETVAEELGRLLVEPRATGPPLSDRAAALELACSAGVLVVVDDPRASVQAWLDDLAAADVVVIEAAHRLELADAATVLTGLGDGHRVVLLGDPAQLQPLGPGRLFADVLASGVVPVVELPPESSAGGHGSPLQELAAAVRAGRLPPVDPAQHEVVVTPVADVAQAITRTVQLVTSSVPRVLAVGPQDTRVLTVRTGGALGALALQRELATAGSTVEASAVHSVAGQRFEAVVLVVPAEAAGSLSRSLLLSVLAMTGRHLSIVHQAGGALAEAVTHRPHPPRRTRLAALLRECVLGPDEGGD